MLTQQPFEPRTLGASLARTGGWTSVGPAYIGARRFGLTGLAGYLEQHATADLVLIVLGDHQPPATVSGADAPWEVPDHVITHRAGILGPLQAPGLQQGLEPGRPALGRMHELTALLLRAFDSARGSSRQTSGGSGSTSLLPGPDLPG